MNHFARERAAPKAPRTEHTFHGNSKGTRHGWLRLTPAYSVRLVNRLLGGGAEGPVLDPFCGTGTTILSCAEHGLDCDSADINPFLIWLARAKLARYSPACLDEVTTGLSQLTRAALRVRQAQAWAPPMHQIENWWDAPTLAALGRAREALSRFAAGSSRPAADLLRIAFCQVLIERSRASFGHQSMSLLPVEAPERDATAAAARVAEGLRTATERLLAAARVPLPATRRRLWQVDARRLHERLPHAHYGTVVTSPPYANRMSYIRELRPYMYWLEYLRDKKRAGELDWQAIGGTWGSATSNLSRWAPDPKLPRAERELEQRLTAIAERSVLLSNYVRKYLEDMTAHAASVAKVLRPGAKVHYVIGNSKFYDVVVPVEELLAARLERAGLSRPSIETLRKRSSKKELYEYLVSAEKPLCN